MFTFSVNTKEIDPFQAVPSPNVYTVERVESEYYKEVFSLELHGSKLWVKRERDKD